MTYRVLFDRKPEPVSADNRLGYNMSLISIALGKYSRGRKSSLSRLQALVWCAKASGRSEQLSGAIASGSSSSSWPVDPALYRVVELMVGEGLLASNGKVVTVSDRGMRFVSFSDDTKLFLIEEERMRSVAKGLTEGYVESCIKGWGSQ